MTTDIEPAFANMPDRLLGIPAEEEPVRKRRTRKASSDTLHLAMEDAPRDGTRVWIETSEGVQIDAFWCKSRRFSGNQWSDASWWAHWGTRSPLPDNVAGWYPYDQ